MQLEIRQSIFTWFDICSWSYRNKQNIGLNFFIKVLKESAGNRGETLYTKYPLEINGDSIILQDR